MKTLSRAKRMVNHRAGLHNVAIECGYSIVERLNNGLGLEAWIGTETNLKASGHAVVVDKTARKKKGKKLNSTI